jgi:hypothetical protein
MACSLERSPSASEDFIGKAGATASIDLRVLDKDKEAEIVHIRYAGDEIDSSSPFEFKIQEGPQQLTVLVEAGEAGIQLALVEVCDDGDEKVLNRFRFNPKSPARGYTVKGVEK